MPTIINVVKNWKPTNALFI